MQPGQQIEIQLVDNFGSPVKVANVLPEIKLFCPGGTRPRYTFLTDPTDKEGRTTVLFNDLEERRVVLSFGDLMDYNTPLTECASTVEISIPPESDFQERRKRAASRPSWWRPAWLMEWPANGEIEAAEPKSVRVEGRHTHVDIVVRLRKRG